MSRYIDSFDRGRVNETDAVAAHHQTCGHCLNGKRELQADRLASCPSYGALMRGLGHGHGDRTKTPPLGVESMAKVVGGRLR